MKSDEKLPLAVGLEEPSRYNESPCCDDIEACPHDNSDDDNSQQHETKNLLVHKWGALRLGLLCGGFLEAISTASRLEQERGRGHQELPDFWSIESSSSTILESVQATALELCSHAEIGICVLVWITFVVSILLPIRNQNSKSPCYSVTDETMAVDPFFGSNRPLLLWSLCLGWMLGSCCLSCIFHAMARTVPVISSIVTASLSLVLCSMMIQWSDWTNQRRTLEVFNASIVTISALYVRSLD
jgi:hypothetical protein